MASFVGGPCDGQELAPKADITVCKGTYYYLAPSGNYWTLDGNEPSPIGTASLGARGPQGWADLRRAINATVPTRARKAQILARSAHRAIVNRRRRR